MSLKSSLKGWFGEIQTTLGRKLLLNGKVYRDLNNVTIETANGTTQIDHVIVSRFGIFVVETKNMNGWIYGSEKDAQWTQVFPNRQKFRFQNPLRQNYRHSKAIAEFLGIDHASIHSVVMFWGECQFKTDMPPNVMYRGYIAYIKSKTTIVFTEEDVDSFYAVLKEGRLPKTWATNRKHLASLEVRRASVTVCPKCGGELNLKTAKRGSHVGNAFLGCSNYPQCRFTRDVQNVNA